MRDDIATVIPLHLHPPFQERRRVAALKNLLLAETRAFTKVALDNATRPPPHPGPKKILAGACALLKEVRNRPVLELL